MQLDEHGDRILFRERTHGTVKREITVTSQRLTFDKRSIAFADVEQMHTDVTEILSYGIKSGTSYAINLLGGPGKPVGFLTQSLPLRCGREEAARQYEEVAAILDEYLVPQLCTRLHRHVMSGNDITIGRAHLSQVGISFGKGQTLAWPNYCGTVTSGREVRVHGPTADVVHGKVFLSNPNSRLLGRLCDRCAQRNV